MFGVVVFVSVCVLLESFWSVLDDFWFFMLTPKCFQMTPKAHKQKQTRQHQTQGKSALFIFFETDHIYWTYFVKSHTLPQIWIDSNQERKTILSWF